MVPTNPCRRCRSRRAARGGVLAVAVLVLHIALDAPTGAVAAQVPPPRYEVVDPVFDPIGGAAAYHGTHDTQGEDAGYRIEVPDDWDGTLVLYAHGYVGAADPRLVVQYPALRDHLVRSGHAWAASSFRRNGYAVKEAIEDTHALLDDWRDLTDGEQPAPERVIVHGASMGGHVAAAAIERRPAAYDGAYPVCGVLGDVALFEYLLDVNLVAGALAGARVPTNDDVAFLREAAPAIVDELQLVQAGARPRGGTQYLAGLEQLSGGERPLFAEAAAYWNQVAAFPTAGGRLPFPQALYGGALTGGIDDPPGLDEAVGNADRTYVYTRLQASADAQLPPRATPGTADVRDLSPQEAALNAVVQRVDGSSPHGLPLELPFPRIRGVPAVPVLTLHTLGDLFVPFRMQQVYAERVAAHGRSDRVVQRTVRAVGHCDFALRELADGFDDLLAWVRGAARPAGDDVRSAAVVRDRRFGCRFTRAQRTGLPPCDAEPVVGRIAGSDRIATSVALSQEVWPDGADRVVLARSDVAPDALAAAGLAGAQRAPLLLTHPGALDPRVRAELRRLGTDRVVLLGDEAALSSRVARAVGRVAEDVARVHGADRYETAANVARALAGEDGADHAFVVRGDDPADGMAVAGLAAFLGEPVLLSRPAALPPPTRRALRALGVTEVTVVGGPQAVRTDVERQIADLGITRRPRIAGADRYATSAAVLRRSVEAGLSRNRPLLANGRDFPGAVSAGPAAAAAGRALLLVDGAGAQLSPTVGQVLTDAALIERLEIVGGPAAVRPAAVRPLRDALQPPQG